MVSRLLIFLLAGIVGGLELLAQTGLSLQLGNLSDQVHSLAPSFRALYGIQEPPQF
jgi:hypothetical protein